MQTQSLRFIVEPYKIGDEAFDKLMDEHYSEIEDNTDIFPLNVNKQTYKALDDVGLCFYMYAYDGDKLVGYSGNIINEHPHFQIKCCQNDCLFLSKKYRKGRAGLKLIKETEQYAKELGCQAMYWSVKSNSSFDKILELLHYKDDYSIYMKKF